MSLGRAPACDVYDQNGGRAFEEQGEPDVLPLLETPAPPPLSGLVPWGPPDAPAYTRAVLRRHLLLALCALFYCSCAKEAAGLRDDLGRTVAIPRKVSRIVTLAPNLTEIVFAIGAGDRVVATDDYSDTPEAARRLPKTGGVQPNVERIAEAHPDLVVSLTASNHPVLASALGAAGIPLYVARTDRLSDVPRVMESMGRLLDANAAPATAARLRAAVESQRRSRSRAPRVLFVIWTEPLYVAGRETFADDLLALAGGKNVVAAKGWPQYSLESVAAAPPEIILYPDKSVQPPQIAALLRAAPPLASARIVPVNENLFTRPGPRVAEAAAELNRTFDSWEKRH